MLRTAIKNLRMHKLRMALTGFAIILGVGFMAGTYIFTDSIQATFNTLFDDVYSGVDVSVRSLNANDTFDEAVLATVQSVDGVANAVPGVAGYAQFLDQEGEPIGGQGPPNLGFSWTNDDELNSFKIAEGMGRAPSAEGEVAMDAATAENNGFSIGDSVQILFAEGPMQEFTLVGIMTFGDANNLAGATIAAFDFEQAQEVFGLEGEVSIIDIRADTGVSPDELQQRVEKVLPDTLEAVTGEAQAEEDINEFTEGLSFLNTALLAFAGIAIFVGAFIIQNTFRIVVSQRSKELALLRALGATKNQVLRLVIYEAAFVGFIASLIGLLVGVGIAYGVRALLDVIGFGIPGGGLEILPRTVIVSMLVGVLVTVVSSILPAIRASRLAPIEALRDSQVPIKKRALVRRGIIGTLMVIIGGLLVVIGLSSDSGDPLYMVGVGVVLQFIGVSVVAPLLSKPFALTAGYVLGRFRGTTATLAARNAARSPRRTASTAAALMIGVSLITMVSILATSFKAAIDDIFAESFSADLMIYSSNTGEYGPGTSPFTSEPVEKLSALDELATVSAVRYAFDDFRVVGDDSVLILAGIDPTTFNDVARLKPSDGAYEKLDNDSIVVKDDRLTKLQKSVGDTITIEYGEAETPAFRTKDYTIVGSFSEPFDTDYFINQDEFISQFDTTQITYIMAMYDSSVEPAAARQAAEDALTAYPQLITQDQSDLKEMAQTTIDQVLAMMWGLLAMAVIIAVFGITNTLMLSISERTHEIGLLRAIGMTRKKLRTMIRYESIIIALFGAILGLGMGLFFAWAVVSALEAEGIKRLVVSYPQLGVYLILAIVAGVLAGAWPAYKAARMNVLKAIAYE